jgi:gliding motility-associated-like protein
MKTLKNTYLSFLIAPCFFLFGKTFLLSQSIFPQINSDPVYLTEEVFIAGGCFDVSNAFVSGGFGAVGTFNNGSSSIGIETGIVLSTGSVLNISGPNTQTNYTTNFNNNNADPDLEVIIDNPLIPIQDVAVLEFDFTPTSDLVSFEYVFASEEYCDFVNTLYNDVFGFFISGPGINGAFTDGAENIALIPGTADFVAINNINHLTNSIFYIDNIPLNDPQVSSCPGGYPNTNGAAVEAIEFDGFTQIMTASVSVIPCETYHIKLVVGDVTDGQYDSAVFLKANSFEAGETVVVDAVSPATNSNVVYEGCNEAYFLFQRFGSNINSSLTVDFIISSSSTAISGQDYDFIPSTVTFEPGEESVQVPVQLISDGIVEGQETLILELESACSCYSTFAAFLIQDGEELTGILEDFSICGSETITLVPVVENGLLPYYYQWSTGSNSSQITLIPDYTETYFLTVTDACGSAVELDAQIDLLPQSEAVLSGNVQICNGNLDGTLLIDITGDAPWELVYSIDEELQEPITILESPYFLDVLAPGNYKLETIESNSCPGFVEGVVEVVISDLMIESAVNNISCIGDLGSISLEVSGGSMPYSFSWNNTPENTSEQTGLEPGTYTVTIIDDNNCASEHSFVINESDPIEVIASIEQVSCFGQNNGALSMGVIGGNSPFLFRLNENDFQEESFFDGLFAGSYLLEVKDASGCQASIAVILEQPDLLESSVNFNAPLCFNSTDGFINVNAFGGVGAFSYSLNGIDFQHEYLFSNLLAGDYTVYVKDSMECLSEQAVLLPMPDEMEIEVISSPPLCYDENTGQIEIVAIGGAWPLNYSINNGPSQSEPIFSNLPSGEFTIQVFDDNNCSVSKNVILDSPIIDIPQILGNNQLCTGSCEYLSVSGNFQNYYWNTGEEGSTIEICEAGHYDVTIVSANGCLSFTDFWVEEVSNPAVQITGDSILCEGETITLGLNDNYPEVNWSNGSMESSIDIITPGTYSVTVSNEAGCGSESLFNVLQNSLDPVVISGVSSICEGGSGWLNLTIPFQDINWSNGSNEAGIEVVDSGWYSVSVIDGNGCESTDSIEVQITDFLTPIITGNQGICPGDTIDLVIAEGFAGYLWSTGDTSNSIKINQPGIYNVTVDDGNSCSGEAAISVEAFIAIEPEINGITHFCSGTTATLYSNQEFDQYLWSDGSLNSSLEVNVSGTYTLSVHDTNGCESSTTIVVEELMPIFENIDKLICAGDTLEFNNQLLSEEGQYFDTLFASAFSGCDSILVLNIFLIQPEYDTLSISIEEGSFFSFGGLEYSMPGIYFDTTVSIQTSCDSITLLNLQVVEYLAFYDTIYFSLCEFEEIEFNSHFYQNTGVFLDTIFGSSQNEGDSIFQINIETLEANFDSLKVFLCKGDSIFLEGSWQKETGSYIDSLSNEFGCDSIVLTELAVSDFEAEIIQLEGLYCHDDSTAILELYIPEGNASYNWLWNTNDTTSVIDNLNPGEYSVTVTDPLGCESTLTYRIENPEAISAEVAYDLICESPDSARLYVETIHEGMEPYLFSLEGGSFYPDSSFMVPSNSSQSLGIEDANGCQLMISEIEIGAALDVELEVKNTQILLGDSVLINAVTNFETYTIEWEFSPFLSCMDCTSPFAFPEITTTFSVKMVSKEGCIIEQSITIFVDQNIDVFIPSVFSPNGDGTNDRFCIFSGKQTKSIKYLDVYNRWGALVFREENFPPNDESMGWDGTFKGNPLNAGVYVYTVQIETITGSKIIEQGEVLLIR